MTRATFVLSSSAILAVGGCVPHVTDRWPVSGTVQVGGLSLDHGHVVFRPAPGQGGPATAARVDGGHFSLPAARGPAAGIYDVSILVTVEGTSRSGHSKTLQQQSHMCQVEIMASDNWLELQIPTQSMERNGPELPEG